MRRIVVAIVLGILALSSFSAPVSSQNTTLPTSLEIEVHRLINDVRADSDDHGHDLQPLQLQSNLIEVAREHSQDMASREFFAHVNPDGDDVSDRVDDAGITWQAVGENLFLSSSSVSEDDLAQEAVDGWVASEGHYANILTGYSYTGIGVVKSGDVYYITQVFLNADPNHLEEIGSIYDNDNLDNLVEEESDTGFSFTPQVGGLIILILVILIGLDAKRRNNQYYGRNYR